MKQLALIAQAMDYGGELRLRKRKTARPLTSKKVMHFVFRSDIAVGEHSFRRTGNRSLVEKNLHRWANHFGVTVYKFSVNSNHIHVAVKGMHRKGLQDFLRVFAGQLAMQLLKRWRVSPRRVWSLRVFSRVCEWGKAFRDLLRYIQQNQREASGQIAYVPRAGKRFPPRESPH